MTSSDLPTIRLKPTAKPQAIRRGFPWVYSNELVLDRRTRALPAGSVVRLEDSARSYLRMVALTPDSKIAARVLDLEENGLPDRAWLTLRLQRALDLRARLYDAPFYRLVHAEADGLPGVIIDRFADICVIQPNAAWAERVLPALTEALIEVTGVTTI